MTINESVEISDFVKKYVAEFMAHGADKFEKVSYKQFKKDFLDLLGVQYLVAEDYLPYRISGEYDPSAVDTMIRKIYDGIELPHRSTSGSAGYDFFSPCRLVISYSEPVTFPTGIKCKINDGWFLGMFPRSGLGFKYGLRISNTVGIIDSDYYDNENNEGHIMIKLVNESFVGNRKPVIIEKGKAYCQGILIPYGVTKDDDARGFRKGGLGSTDTN